MARFPNAVWIPSPNFGSPPGAPQHMLDSGPALGVVQHTTVGGMPGPWFANPVSQVSSHFGVGLDGHVEQYVDTDDVAWHAGYDANHRYFGIEFEDGGNPDIPMTAAQIDSGGRVIIWLWGLYRFPVQPAHVFGDSGVIGHVEVWPAGGHTCPNPTRLAQKQALIDAAWSHLMPPAPPAPTPAPPYDQGDRARPWWQFWGGRL